MVSRLCDDLKKAKLDIVTKLMIVLFMSHFDCKADALGYADFVSQERIVLTCIFVSYKLGYPRKVHHERNTFEDYARLQLNYFIEPKRFRVYDRE